VALQYSGAAEGKPLPMVLEVVVGPVNRGACIRDLSQYPREVEYLYLPMSFISPDGTPRFTISSAGIGVRVIPVQVHLNLLSRTVEQILSQKKRMHNTAFRFLLMELEDELALRADEGGAALRLAGDASKNQRGEHTVDGLLKGIMRQCEAVLERHEAVKEEGYADDSVHRGLVAEMLDARRWAVSKLRVWLENSNTSICLVQEYTLRGAHRRLVAFLERQLEVSNATAALSESEGRRAALEVCKARGLLRACVDEANESGEPPLVTAAADGASTADLRLLLAAGCSINGAEGEPSAALTEAARYGRGEAIGMLLEAKAMVNASTKVFREPLLC
jgi:hypothetical protein